MVFIFNTARATYYLAVPSCIVRHSSATLEVVGGIAVDPDVESRGSNGPVTWVVHTRVGFGIKINISLCNFR